MTSPLPAPAQPGETHLPKVGRADRCQASRVAFTHRPARFVWHHILPQACGGQTEPVNLATLCDNCHYAVHAALWALAHGEKPDTRFGRAVRKLAQQGYDAAVAAGTEGKIPHQA